MSDNSRSLAAEGVGEHPSGFPASTLDVFLVFAFMAVV